MTETKIRKLSRRQLAEQAAERARADGRPEDADLILRLAPPAPKKRSPGGYPPETAADQACANYETAARAFLGEHWEGADLDAKLATLERAMFEVLPHVRQRGAEILRRREEAETKELETDAA